MLRAHFIRDQYLQVCFGGDQRLEALRELSVSSHLGAVGCRDDADGRPAREGASKVAGVDRLREAP